MTQDRSPSWLALLAVLGSVTFLALGTSWAKHSLFPRVGAEGATALRVGFSAVVLLVLWRPWRQRPTAADLVRVALYGAALGAMNLFFYMALQTIPFGIAVAIEFSGLLGLALLTSRRPSDFLWVLLAVAGLALLLPIGRHAGTLDPRGLAFALAAAVFWAAYILFGKRVGHLHAGHSVALGLSVAALLVVPVGVAHAGAALFAPHLLAVGLGVAVLSSAIPISLEMVALKRLPPQAFGIMVSLEPAVSALLAWILLGEWLQPRQWLAIGLVMAASIGSTVMPARRRGALAAAAAD